MRNLKRFCLMLLAAAVLLTPLMALATTADIPEYGVTVHFPASLDVFTNNMEADNPVLALYDTTADEVRGMLSGRGLAAKAQDIAGKFVITLSLSSAAKTSSAVVEAEPDPIWLKAVTKSLASR